MLEFDWYQGTVLGEPDPDDLLQNVLYGAGGLVLTEAGAGYNRPLSYRGDYEGGSIAIYYGQGQDVHFLGSGGAAPHMANTARALYPLHTVSRADVALDFDEPGCFDQLWKRIAFMATSRVSGRPVGTSTMGDWLEAKKGRTLYAGSRSSVMMIRCYEKGLEQAAKHPDQAFSGDWTRVEWQIRPDTRTKRTAATATPEELAAWTPFGASILEVLATYDGQPFRHPPAAETDPEFWLARQYGRILRDWLLLNDAELRSALAHALEVAASSPRPPVRTPTGTEFLPPAGMRLDRA